MFCLYAIIAIKHNISMHEHSPGPAGGAENRGHRHKKSWLIPVLTLIKYIYLTLLHHENMAI